MDFNDTPEEASFRQEARGWLEANAPTKEELKGSNLFSSANLNFSVAISSYSY